MKSKLKALRALYFYLFLGLLVFSCTPTKELIIPRSQIHYQLVERAFVENNDTTYVNELQFDPVASATDFQSAMYNNFGKWDVKYDGKYNPNIAQITWEHCKLLGTEEEFYILTDGEESATEYFSAVMVFDQKGKDLLTKDNPNRDLLIERLIVIMQNKGPHRNL
jgi:hypothetical protein